MPVGIKITVAVKPEDLQDGDEADVPLRVSKREVLIRRGDQWFRYGAPKRVS
jgi:hypothetical protein